MDSSCSPASLKVGLALSWEIGSVLRMPRDNIFALVVNQEVSVKLLSSIRCVARKGDARSRALALVAKHHSLHVYRCSEVI